VVLALGVLVVLVWPKLVAGILLLAAGFRAMSTTPAVREAASPVYTNAGKLLTQLEGVDYYRNP
jgi:hypothetical protein